MSIVVTRDDIPREVLEICERLRKAGHYAWIVGGCMRDLLLGKTVSDWDLATSATPEEVTKCFPRVIPTGIAHGTVTVRWKHQSYEVTTLRGEGAYSDGRRPDNVFFVRDIEADLERRDFTMNAIAFDPLDDRIVDPYGGIDDLNARLLRAVGDPERRFDEDGLRVLRAARFVATLEVELDPQTRDAIPATLDTFRKVSRERVRDEWMKTMKAKKPSRAFDVMRETGILSVTLPELVTQYGCTQNKYHAYDVWRHTMECLDACDGPAPLRIAALLHDIGKPATRALSDKTHDYTFYEHEQVGAEMADKFLREYRFSNVERESIVRLVRHHLVCYSSEWTDGAVRRFVKRVGEPYVDDLLHLARADALGKGRPVDVELAQLDELGGRIETLRARGAALSTKDLAVTGSDIMESLGLAPGRKVGVILAALLERVLEEPELNERVALLGLAKQLAEDKG